MEQVEQQILGQVGEHTCKTVRAHPGHRTQAGLCTMPRMGGYAELRRAVVGAGLLERAYTYYAWRTALSFLMFGVGMALPFTLAPSVLALVLSALVIGF